jgi:beta-phosphoglucomutase-like phosphatase (HAD superfamily)
LKSTHSEALKPENPAILFDLDGTLIDTAYEHVLAWSSALRNAGIEIPNWKIHRRIGMSGKSLIRQLVREHDAGTRKIHMEELDKQHDAERTKALRRLPAPARSKNNCFVP